MLKIGMFVDGYDWDFSQFLHVSPRQGLHYGIYRHHGDLNWYMWIAWRYIYCDYIDIDIGRYKYRLLDWMTNYLRFQSTDCLVRSSPGLDPNSTKFYS